MSAPFVRSIPQLWTQKHLLAVAERSLNLLARELLTL
jgi:hypothetical protein